MSQVRWNPFREIDELFDRYNRVFALPTAAQLPGDGANREALARPDWLPAVDIFETSDAFRLKVELPDVEKEDVKVSLNNGVLSISGERKLELADGETRHRRIERSYGSFSRSFTLPEQADEKGIDAAYRNGVLTLTIPKAPKQEPRAIEVKVH